MRSRGGNLIDEIQRDALDGSPLAGTLRKLVALGGQVRSTELREWASVELRGYVDSGIELPDYRKPGAVLQVDAISGRYRLSGQQISPRMLPDVIRDDVGEEVPLGQPVGELEAMRARAEADGGHIKLTLPLSQDVASLINQEVGDPYQHITALYWSVSAVALAGVLDRVRTTLTELLAEMRAGMPTDGGVPTAALADQAVSVVVHGRGARINVTSAQAEGEGSHHVQASMASDSKHGWRRIGAFCVGAATILAALMAFAQWQGWGI